MVSWLKTQLREMFADVTDIDRDTALKDGVEGVRKITREDKTPKHAKTKK